MSLEEARPFGRRASDSPELFDAKLAGLEGKLLAEIRAVATSVANAQAQSTREHQRVEARLERIETSHQAEYSALSGRVELIEDERQQEHAATTASERLKARGWKIAAQALAAVCVLGTFLFLAADHF